MGMLADHHVQLIAAQLIVDRGNRVEMIEARLHHIHAADGGISES